MIPADRAVQRPRDAKLLVVDARGRITHAPRSRLIDFLRPADLVVANDAATMPASLRGRHVPTGAEIEVRLAGPPGFERRRAAAPADSGVTFTAVVFGAGDYTTRTEDRPLPPPLETGDRLALGPLSATIAAVLDHPRLVSLRFDGSDAAVWDGLSRHGRPIQYAHMRTPLELWDVWTPVAASPSAFEAPSAGFALSWELIRAMRERGIAFTTITLAAGLSSTGDAELDRRLPLDEPYRIPEVTASAILRARASGDRVVAVGTTVVRALEHRALDGTLRPGDGIADQRVGPAARLRVVDAILSGTHEPDSSHYQMLRAFVDDDTLGRISAALERGAYRTHEFGDSVLLEKADRRRDLSHGGPSLLL